MVVSVHGQLGSHLYDVWCINSSYLFWTHACYSWIGPMFPIIVDWFWLILLIAPPLCGKRIILYLNRACPLISKRPFLPAVLIHVVDIIISNPKIVRKVASVSNTGRSLMQPVLILCGYVRQIFRYQTKIIRCLPKWYYRHIHQLYLFVFVCSPLFLSQWIGNWFEGKFQPENIN